MLLIYWFSLYEFSYCKTKYYYREFDRTNLSCRDKHFSTSRKKYTVRSITSICKSFNNGIRNKSASRYWWKMYALYHVGFIEVSISRNLKNYFFAYSNSKSNFNARQVVSKSRTKFFFASEVKCSSSRSDSR